MHQENVAVRLSFKLWMFVDVSPCERGPESEKEKFLCEEKK